MLEVRENGELRTQRYHDLGLWDGGVGFLGELEERCLSVIRLIP